MADKYGGLVIPIESALQAGTFPFEQACGDILLGYLGDYLRTMFTVYAQDAWNSIRPNKKIVNKLFLGQPEDGFSEQYLPALYVYRPGRETRELVESFEQTACDYRFQKGRVVVQWIMDNAPDAHRRERDEIIDGLRKITDMKTQLGRDPAWKVPVDQTADPHDKDAPVWGSSLANYAGFATLELLNAAQGQYIHEMMTPAPKRYYTELRASFYCEELLERDLELIGFPHEELGASYHSPDQGTGLGNFDLGSTIYK